MELTPIYRSVVALDVHQAKLTVCALFEDEHGEVRVELKEFGGFKRDRRAMAEWVASFAPQAVVMESTGIYWKSPYAALEEVGIQALVVNAHHVKQVPGRKTDIADAQWLTILAHSGLLKGGFVPPSNFRHLRVPSRQLQKFTGILCGENNHLHKVFTDGGIRLSVVVSDIHGQSARRMIKAPLAGETPEQVLAYASKRLKASNEVLLDALDCPEKLAAWAGVCPGNNESAGKRKAGRKRKGNPFVRRILREEANAVSRTRSGLADKFQPLLIRRGRKRAIFALAHKILKIVFVLISRGDYYRDATIDYEALSVERNAPRWIRMLRKYGYITA
ncbi:MAG: transposase [Gammaproteobacteria bacterium]|jgi:transposase|nr:transposase [Gammaproteobacteria bacterium]